MKNKFIKSISVMLVVIMCFMASVSAFAESSSEVLRTCPRVFIHGFMSQDIYQNPDDPESPLAWPLEQTAITDTVKAALAPLARLAIDRDLDRFGSALAPMLDELFYYACSDYNGEVTNGSGIRFAYPQRENVKKDSSVSFNYDWRLDPYVLASQLNDFINYILECSGSEQVVIECHSFGSVVTTTYLKLYGNEKIKSVVYNAAALFGETYTGELLNGKIDISPDGLKYFLDYCFDGTDSAETISLVCDMLKEAGLFDFVCEFAEDILAGIYDEVIPSVMKLFANWPTIWTMVPDDDLAGAKEFIFGLYKEAGINCSGLEEKVNTYNSEIRSQRENIIKNAAESTNIYVISRYGYSAVPITPSWNKLGDGVVDAKYSSFGATTALYGEKLNTQASKYVSPDETIDASTCLLPDQTWFVKGLKHSDMAECLDVVMDKLLYSDERVTVDTFEEYPQFLKYDWKTSSIAIDDATDTITFFDVIKVAILEIINLIKLFFESIGGAVTA